LEWAAPGKLVVMFTRLYDPVGDLGHTSTPGSWSAICVKGVAEPLQLVGPDDRAALPAIEASLNDPRMAQRRDVLLRLAEVREKLK